MAAKLSYRRRVGAFCAVAAFALGLLSVISALAGSAQATQSNARTVHVATAGPTLNPALRQLLARLAKAQGINPATGRPITPSPTPTAPTTSSAPTSPSPTPTPTDPGTSSAPSTPTQAPSPTDPGTPTSAAPAGPSVVDPSVAGDSLTWSDEFNGPAGSAPNPSNWTQITGGRWGNGEIECYTNSRDNSALNGDGDLVLTARYTPGHQCDYGATNNYTSARLTSENLTTAKYGELRVRAIVPAAQGVWPAIWALGDNNDSIGWPNAGEIDMMEAIGQTETMYGNIHFPSSSGPAGLGTGYQLSSPMNTNYHIYGVDWSPTQVSMLVDGHVFKTITKADVLAAGGSWVFDRPFYFLLNIAVGGTWPGDPKDNSVFPQAMKIDYVRVYH